MIMYEQLYFSEIIGKSLQEVADMESRVFSTPWSSEQYQAMVENGRCKVFGLYGKNNRLVAYVAVSLILEVGEIEIYNIAVDPDRRRQGIGGYLMGNLINTARLLKLKHILLEVRESNVTALGLYLKNGFALVGRRKNYYSKPTEDALLYSLQL